jgi:hypothetical protein
MAGSVHIPWYATVFRGDKFEEALLEIAPLALRYGARDFQVYRSRDDRYKFLHASTFETKLEWERYWNGPEFIQWREKYSSWYQIPVLYVWHDMIISGASELAESDDEVRV